MVFRAEWRRRWRSWLALAALVAVVGGLSIGAVAAGNRTARAFPGFVKVHGFDGFFFTNAPLPQLTHLPEVASVTTVVTPFNGQPTCACTGSINSSTFNLFGMSSAALARTVNLVAGRMPNPSDPHEVLASFDLMQNYGVHIGTLFHVPLFAASQASAVENSTGAGPNPTGPTVSLRVVGIEAAELEFPSGTNPFFDLYTTPAFDRSVVPETTSGPGYLVKLRNPMADGPKFKNEVKALGAQNIQNEDTPAQLIQGSIHPQAVGWWVLAVLAALAGVAVIGQAISRQRFVESEEFLTFGALGVVSRQFLLLSMAGTAVVAVAGAVGALLVAYLVSPLAPVGEARFAETSTGLAFDAPVLLLGALTVIVGVLLLGIWPAVRTAHRRTRTSGARPSAVVNRLAAAGASPTAVIGVRHALERGRGTNPVPLVTAWLGTILAVTALAATAVFGASLSHLTVTPSLYGDAFQLLIYDANAGPPTQLIKTLERQPSVSNITLGTGVPLVIDKVHVTSFVTSVVRGPVELSTVNGTFPNAPGEIGLGATTMHQAGAHIGSIVPVVVQNPNGGSRTVRMRVVATVAFPTGIAASQAGLGTGAAMSMSAFLDAACAPGAGRGACTNSLLKSTSFAVFISTVGGTKGRAVIAHLNNAFQGYTQGPYPPTGLVNFGEAVNFPLIFGIMLAVFGAATLAHLLVVTVHRRRQEMGLLKALGFTNWQIGSTVFWQAAAVTVIGIVIGTPLGVAIGRMVWRSFAINVGVVPAPVVKLLLLAALSAGVLAAAALMALAPAVVASRYQPSKLLRSE
jgi:FtsX-like permease family